MRPTEVHFRAVRIRSRIIGRRPLALVAAVALGAGLSACGHKEAHPTSADTEGPYVDAGPISYQVQLSRQLNPFAIEDRTYLTGVDSPPLKPDEMWFAVFMWAKNGTHQDATTTNSFDIIDTQGTKYYPVSINPAINPFAWTAQTLRPQRHEPRAGQHRLLRPHPGRRAAVQAQHGGVLEPPAHAPDLRAGAAVRAVHGVTRSLTDDDSSGGPEPPPPHGPSTPPDLRFNPLATGIGVFAGVAIPIVVVGYTRSAGPNNTIILIGVAVGLLAGIIAGIWVAHRDGRVWRGPQL